MCYSILIVGALRFRISKFGGLGEMVGRHWFRYYILLFVRYISFGMPNSLNVLAIFWMELCFIKK